MSKVVSSVQGRSLGHVVECNDEFYYVDSIFTFDHDLETMVFKCDENGKNVNWHDLYVEWLKKRELNKMVCVEEKECAE